MSYESLKLRVRIVRDYQLPDIEKFVSSRNIQDKEVWQLKKRRTMGIKY